LQAWTVYLDADGDGTLDAGERSSTTDANGYYALGGLAAGTYTVREVVPTGWKQTWPGSPNESFTLTISTSSLWAEADFGNARGAVYGWLWNDVSLDQEWDVGESALAGWTVYLDANETRTVTETNGYYAFGGLPPGTYTVAEVVQNGWQQTWPGAPEFRHTVAVATDSLWAAAYFGNSQNLRPVAEAGGPYTSEAGTPITLDGSASLDADGTISLYEWDFNGDGHRGRGSARSADGDHRGDGCGGV
jgi:hypothetical protein